LDSLTVTLQGELACWDLSLSDVLYFFRWIGAASVNVTMGDANYYAALLQQYYYGSNASEF